MGIIQLYMSVTVKVQFKDKLFKLSQGITSLQQVDQEMKRRYSNKLPPLEYLFEGSIVEDLPSLLKALTRQGKASVKIVARPLKDMSRLSEISFIQIVSNERENEVPVCKAEESVISLQENLVKVQQKLIELPQIDYQMPKWFYVCYNCQGSGVYETSGLEHLCEICQGRGELNNDHRYIQHIKKLFEKHVHQNAEKTEVIVEEIKKPAFSKVFRGVNRAFELSINEINKIERMEIGKEFICKFQIHNQGMDLPENLQVVDCDSKVSMQIKTLKSGEKMVIELGPFKCENQSLLEKTFYICERKDYYWQRLGYKFGFRTRGFRNIEVKKLEPSYRDLIRNMKLLSGSRKSEDYIAMKLKAMDIDLSNIEIEDEILIEIIKNIN